MRTTNDVTPGIYSVSEIPNCKANDIFVCIDGNYPRFFEVLYFDIYTDNMPLSDCFRVYSVGSIFDDTRDKYIPDRNNSVTDSIISDSGYGIRKLTYNSDGNVRDNGSVYNHSFAIRPCFYLNSDVQYASGSGTESDPIRLVV